MSTELLVLCITAASIGFIHTLLGPDHYIPFVAMSRGRRWSVSKTALVTILCGVGHIIGSVVLGAVGIIFGIGIMQIEALESFRGNLAAWALIGFGLAYFIWGVRKALKTKHHDHLHLPTDKKKNITPWVLFTIFVLGPCEPLIPILMYPVAKSSLSGLLIVVGIFGSVTIVTMLGVVMLSIWGMNFLHLGRFERYAHAVAGGTICLSGLAVQYLAL